MRSASLLLALPSIAALLAKAPVRRTINSHIEKSVAATMGRVHGAKEGERSLASFMQQSPDELAVGLKHHLSPDILDVHVTGEENAESGLVLSSKRVYLGPRALGLWLQPRFLLWVRSRRKGRLICEAACLGAEMTHGLSLRQLSVSSRLTWIESAIDHLHGTVPCLLVNSKLQFEFDMKAANPLLSMVPTRILELLCNRAANHALTEVQEALASALVESYEEWCEWQDRIGSEPAEPAIV